MKFHLLLDIKNSQPNLRAKRNAEYEREVNYDLFDQLDPYDMNEDQNITNDMFDYDYNFDDNFTFIDESFHQIGKPNKPLIRISITGHVRTVEEVKGKGTK